MLCNVGQTGQPQAGQIVQPADQLSDPGGASRATGQERVIDKHEAATDLV